MAGRRQRDALRRHLADEAARLLADEGVAGYAAARHKAAQRLGVRDTRLWPKGSEIQEALISRQRLFHRDQGRVLAGLMQRAAEAMTRFRRFRPRLVGGVREGTADRRTPVRLHLFAETPEEVILELLEQGIPWDERSLDLPYADGGHRRRPLLYFMAGEVTFELLILPPLELHDPPLSPIDDRPERGLDLDEVNQRLEMGT